MTTDAAETEPQVYRAPMRSRSDDVDAAAAVEWALSAGVVGVGRRGAPHELDRIEARRQRFGDVPDGAFVWTLDGDGLVYVGQITGPVRDEPHGAPHDLEQVRPCRWHRDPVPPARIPPAVAATFERGGRNFQRTRADGVGRQTALLWADLTTD